MQLLLIHTAMIERGQTAIAVIAAAVQQTFASAPAHALAKGLPRNGADQRAAGAGSAGSAEGFRANDVALPGPTPSPQNLLLTSGDQFEFLIGA